MSQGNPSAGAQAAPAAPAAAAAQPQTNQQAEEDEPPPPEPFGELGLLHCICVELVETKLEANFHRISSGNPNRPSSRVLRTLSLPLSSLYALPYFEG